MDDGRCCGARGKGGAARCGAESSAACDGFGWSSRARSTPGQAEKVGRLVALVAWCCFGAAAR